MKKDIRILLITLTCLAVVLGLYYATVHDTNGISVGMTYSEARELAPDDAFFYLNYCFYENIFGHPVIVEFSKNNDSVAKINCYAKSLTGNSGWTFSSIKSGMSVQQVVSKVGVPAGSYTSGMITLAYDCSNGSQCCIYLLSEDDGYVVDSVGFRSA